MNPSAPSHTNAPRAVWLTSALIALLCLIWGSTWIVIRGGLADLPPLTSAAARFLLAAAVMTVLAALLAAREGGTRPAPWLSFTLGVTNFALSYGVVYATETRLPSGIVSVLWSIFPMLMAASGHLFLPGERLRGSQWLGFVIGFLGVGMLFITDLRQLGPQAIPAGLLLFTSPLAAAIGTTAVKRCGSGASSLLLNRDAMWIGALLLCAGAWFAERDRPSAWTTSALWSVVYLALVGTVVAFGLYFWLLRHTAAHRMSLISYVTPAIALFLGWFFADEPIHRSTLAGSALILLGVALVVRGHARRATLASVRAPDAVEGAAPAAPSSSGRQH